MLKKILCIAVFFAGLAGYAQVGGKSVYQFLNMVTSPRQAALGGKILTIYDGDVNQGHFNPAAINSEMNNHLSLNYGSYYGDVSYGTAAYAYTFDRRIQTFFGGVNYVNYGKFEGYDENGQKTADFTGSEAALTIGYARDLFSGFYVGANARLINSTLESYNSFGASVDLGVLYVDEKNDINWAFVVRNIGGQITTYSDVRESVPFEIMAGVSQKLEHVPIRWHLTLENLQQWQVAFSNPNRAQSSLDGTSTPEDISFLNNMMRHVIVGAEFFPEKGFNLRVGYNFRRAAELSMLEQKSFAGFSVGFGLKVNKLKFNYSYSRYSLAANTNLFGLTIDLSRNEY